MHRHATETEMKGEETFLHIQAVILAVVGKGRDEEKKDDDDDEQEEKRNNM